ncbi:serine/arginine repetitive matrix protein 1-like [Antennarius striatus]|uniref:serine/arginine repetitive matrix protein 1-like n=1 Tax=Antennarius striatus TaxID=241820 RepID=UPI0035B408A7
MAAIDLERGLEHGGRGWGKERPELMDNFDSEMQEWEDQLQDIQRKIEELYSEVQARRGANDIITDNQKHGNELECSPEHHGNNLFAPSHHSKNHSGALAMPHHYTNGCNYSQNGHNYPVSHQNGYAYCHANGVPEIGDLLQDYLGQGKQMGRKNNGARHVHFSDMVKLSSDIPPFQNEIRSSFGNERLIQEQFLGSLEDNENRKNQVSHMKSSTRRESSPNKENSGSKPPLGQRDAPAVQSRSQLPITAAESPALDRKSFSTSSSPSVLRKFGAMLQENEGKMLTESGVVTQQGLASETKSPTPGCQRRSLGATAVAGKAPIRVPSQKCQANSDVLTAEVEPRQEWGLDSAKQNHKDHKGGYIGSKGSQRSPQQPQKRSQVAGSPKIRSRSNSGTERDGLAQGEKARKPASQHVESKTDYRISTGSSGAQKVPRGGSVAQELPGCGPLRDDGLIELLDMLEIQHEYSSSPRTGHTAYKQEPQQVNPADLLPGKPKKRFSRPARPANQRPPSRWASRTPMSRDATPSGPMYRPPSPLARPASPMTRTPSPAPRHRPVMSYSRETETVIM